MAFTGIKSRCCQDCSPFWRFQWRIHVFAFSGFWMPPIFLGSWPPSSIWWHSIFPNILSQSHMTETSWERFSSRKDPGDGIGPVQMPQENLPISRFLTLITSAEFRVWTSLKNHYSAYHMERLRENAPKRGWPLSLHPQQPSPRPALPGNTFPY